MAIILIVVIVSTMLFLVIQYNDPFRFNFLTDEQIEFIKQSESLCNDYSAISNVSCMNKVHAKILEYQIDGASDKAIDIHDVAVCHSIAPQIDCLLAVAEKSNDKEACDEILDSKHDSKYLKAMQNYCLNWYKKS
jgi:hypothetical protein